MQALVGEALYMLLRARGKHPLGNVELERFFMVSKRTMELAFAWR